MEKKIDSTNNVIQQNKEGDKALSKKIKGKNTEQGKTQTTKEKYVRMYRGEKRNLRRHG